jgi:hypothetical protein
MRKVLPVLLLALSFLSAQAADLPPVYKAPLAPRSYLPPAPVPCTTNQCTGWFAGVTLMGMGSNADILGQGLDNSVFANGGAAGLTLGAQYWMGGVFLGAENFVGYSFGNPATVGAGQASVGGSGLDVLWFEAGGSLGDLFGSGAQPVPIQTALISDLIAPYFGTGPAVAFGGNSTVGSSSFWTSGAGVRYLLPNANRPILLDFKYVYGVNNNVVGLASNKNLQLVGVTLSLPFGF